MAEYSEREGLRKILEDWRDAHADVGDERGCGLLEDVIWEVNAQPAADVAPVVHGQWDHIGIVKNIGPIYPHCSVCGTVSAAYRSQWEGLQGPWKYCPNCGAKMDGGVS